MRHLLALFALAFALVACDDTATTAPADTIPGPPDAPRLEVTALTGTKAAPVDSPTVKVQWWYKDSVHIAVGNSSRFIINPTSLIKGIGDTTVKVACGSLSTDKIYVAVYVGNPKYDSVQVYCKAP